MAKKKSTKTKDVVADNSAITPEINVPTADEAKKNNELVMTATFKSEATVMNKSQNIIHLKEGQLEIRLMPREIKRVPKDVLKELLKNPMVRRFFDKGVVSHTLDDTEVSAHDAVAPEHLMEAVERHEDGSSVSASVKKFQREGSVNIELG